MEDLALGLSHDGKLAAFLEERYVDDPDSKDAMMKNYVDPVSDEENLTLRTVYDGRMRRLSLVSVNFDASFVTQIVKDQRSSATDKISSIGGTLGFFTGFSVLSICEILYFVYRGLGRRSGPRRSRRGS